MRAGRGRPATIVRRRLLETHLQKRSPPAVESTAVKSTEPSAVNTTQSTAETAEVPQSTDAAIVCDIETAVVKDSAAEAVGMRVHQPAFVIPAAPMSPAIVAPIIVIPIMMIRSSSPPSAIAAPSVVVRRVPPVRVIAGIAIASVVSWQVHTSGQSCCQENEHRERQKFYRFHGCRAPAGGMRPGSGGVVQLHRVRLHDASRRPC